MVCNNTVNVISTGVLSLSTCWSRSEQSCACPVHSVWVVQVWPCCALGCPAAVLCLLAEHLQPVKLCWLSNLGKGREIDAPQNWLCLAQKVRWERMRCSEECLASEGFPSTCFWQRVEEMQGQDLLAHVGTGTHPRLQCRVGQEEVVQEAMNSTILAVQDMDRATWVVEENICQSPCITRLLALLKVLIVNYFLIFEGSKPHFQYRCAGVEGIPGVKKEMTAPGRVNGMQAV